MGSSRQQLCAIQIVDTHETEKFNEFAIRLLCLQDSFILGDFVPLNSKQMMLYYSKYTEKSTNTE